MIDTVIRAGIAYSFYAVPYSILAITKLDKKFIGIQKIICGLPKCTANITTQLPHDIFGLEAFSLKNAYLRCISEQLRNALNDPGRLGIIYKRLIQYILAKYGGEDIHRKKIPRLYNITYYKNIISYEEEKRGPPQEHRSKLPISRN